MYDKIVEEKLENCGNHDTTPNKSIILTFKHHMGTLAKVGDIREKVLSCLQICQGGRQCGQSDEKKIIY